MMMVNGEVAVRKILDYLNGDMDRLALVHWAEDALFALSESNKDVPDEQALMRILGYLGAGDRAGFPLTWDILSQFLMQLGTRVRVVAEAA